MEEIYIPIPLSQGKTVGLSAWKKFTVANYCFLFLVFFLKQIEGIVEKEKKPDTSIVSISNNVFKKLYSGQQNNYCVVEL